MTDYQKNILSLLKEFHNFCTENNINYSLHGGTLLGAVREHGFIPWDDDADVSLTRDEYEKLIAAYNNKSCKLDFQIDQYNWFIPKVFIFDENNQMIWVDIFVYDYITENYFGQKLKFFIEDIFLALSKNSISLETMKKNRNHILRYHITKLISIFGKLFDKEKLIQKKEKISKSILCGRKVLIHRSSDKHVGRVIILNHNIMKDYITIKFEDFQPMISAKYDDILVSSYGEDYLIPIRPNNIDLDGHNLTKNCMLH